MLSILIAVDNLQVADIVDTFISFGKSFNSNSATLI